MQPVANPVSSSVAKLILPAPRLNQKLSSSSAQLKQAKSRVGGREVGRSVAGEYTWHSKYSSGRGGN